MATALEDKLVAFKKEFPRLLSENTQNYDWLPAFYMRAAYFRDSFSPKIARDALCDGTNDGGFDAVFANPDSQEKEIVIVQGKWYKHCPRPDDVVSELKKIVRTWRQFVEGGDVKCSDRVKEAYRNASVKLDPDEVSYAIDFVTSGIPRSERQRKELLDAVGRYRELLERRFNNISVNLVLGDRLLNEAETWDQECPFVEEDVFRWFNDDGCLRYENSILINLSASSLRDVYYSRGKSVLGLNLRYHVRRSRLHREVDDGIKKTIQEQAERFWYLNNGVMIVCRDYQLDLREGKLKLFDYSIVNGGQTTFNIYEHLKNGVKDFAVVCKIVRLADLKKKSGALFAQAIAVSANSQKPIKKASLVANNYEQIELGAALRDKGIYYIRKEGDKPSKKEFYYRETIENIGSLGLCGLLLMPMEARNNKQLMFEEPYYNLIFDKHNALLFSDLIKLRDEYTKFSAHVKGRKRRPNGFEDTEHWETYSRIVSIGRTFALSSISFLIRTMRNVLDWEDMKASADDSKRYARTCGKLKGVNRLLAGDNLAPGIIDTCFEKIMRVICDAYMKLNDSDITVEMFMKRRDTFLGHIASRLRGALRKDAEFKEAIKNVWKAS